MKPIILIAAMASWLFVSACGTDPRTAVDSDGPDTGKPNRTGQQAADAGPSPSRPGRAPDDVDRSTPPPDLGVPLYPGANVAQGRWAPAGVEDLAAQQGLATSLFFSTDPITDVAAFYRKNLLEAKPQVYEMDLPSGRMVNIMLRRAGGDTNIVLSEPREKTGTLIRITRVLE